MTVRSLILPLRIPASGFRRPVVGALWGLAAADLLVRTQMLALVAPDTLLHGLSGGLVFVLVAVILAKPSIRSTGARLQLGGALFLGLAEAVSLGGALWGQFIAPLTAVSGQSGPHGAGIGATQLALVGSGAIGSLLLGLGLTWSLGPAAGPRRRLWPIAAVGISIALLQLAEGIVEPAQLGSAGRVASSVLALGILGWTAVAWSALAGALDDRPRWRSHGLIALGAGLLLVGNATATVAALASFTRTNPALGALPVFPVVEAFDVLSMLCLVGGFGVT